MCLIQHRGTYTGVGISITYLNKKQKTSRNKIIKQYMWDLIFYRGVCAHKNKSGLVMYKFEYTIQILTAYILYIWSIFPLIG